MYSIFRNIANTNVPAISSERWSRWHITKAIFLLGVPLIVGELGSIVQQYADTIMVGHYGTKHLAAASFVNTVFYFVVFLILGMSYAVTPLVGNAFGRKDYRDVCQVFREGIRTSVLVGAFFVAVLLLLYFNLEELFFTSTIFGEHYQPIEILELSKKYWLILTASVPFLTLFYACKQYLDGIGKTGVSMWILLGSNLLNIGLNWCLIFGKCGFPDMGLFGAGIATLVSRIVQLVLIALAVKNLPIVREYYHSANPSWNGVWKQIKLGCPISLQLGLEIGMFSVCGIFAGWLSVTALAAHQAMYTISTLFFQVLYGIGAAGSILISQFHSVKAWSNIKRTARITFWIGFGVIIPLSFSAYHFFFPLASNFTTDEAVQNAMSCIFVSLLLYQFGDCIQITYANALRGLGCTKPLFIIAFFSYFVISIPLSYFYTFKFMTYMESNGLADLFDWWTPEFGLWYGIPMGLFVAGILFWLVFRFKLRSLIKKS